MSTEICLLESIDFRRRRIVRDEFDAPDGSGLPQADDFPIAT